MREDQAELQRLQDLVDDSVARASPFLREAFTMPEHTLSARQLVRYLEGAVPVAVATVNSKGDPQVVPIHSIFVHGRFFIAPLDVSSGRQQRHRLNRAGNRQLNRALHTIAIVQKRVYAPAKAYIARHQADGKTNKEALKALKRQLARRVFHILTLIAGRTDNPQRIQISTPPLVPCLT